MAWLQISQGPKEGKEEKKGEKINDDLKLDDSFLNKYKIHILYEF